MWLRLHSQLCTTYSMRNQNDILELTNVMVAIYLFGTYTTFYAYEEATQVEYK